MRESVRRRLALLLAFAMPLITVLCVGLFLPSTFGWENLGIRPYKGTASADLLSLTSTIVCVYDDPSVASDLVKGEMTCDPLGRAWNYPSAWLTLAPLLGPLLKTIPHSSVAAISVVWFAVTLGLISLRVYQKSDNLLGPAMLSILTVSSPVLLLFERGNIDIIVFCLVAMSLLLLEWRRYRPLALVGIFLAGVLKYIPFGAVLALMPIGVSDLRRRGLLGGTLLIGVLVGSLVLVGMATADFARISAATPQGAASSFGISVLPSFAQGNLLENEPYWVVLYVFAVIGLIAVIAFPIAGRIQIGIAAGLVNGIRENDFSRNLFLGGSGVFLFSYILGSSFDYRLVFLLLVIAALSAVPNRFGFLVSVLIFLVMFNSFGRPIVWQVLGDLVLFFVVIVLTAITIVLLTMQFTETRQQMVNSRCV